MLENLKKIEICEPCQISATPFACIRRIQKVIIGSIPVQIVTLRRKGFMEKLNVAIADDNERMLNLLEKL